jgi:NADH-quinone oxidoreductase subunit N
VNLAALSWLHRAEILLVLAALVLLAFARNFERSRVAVAGVVLAGAIAALACGVMDTGAARLALVVVPAALIVAALLLPSAELFDERQSPEAGALLLVGATGGVVLTTAASLLEMAIGVEMISLAGAALTGLGRGLRPLEGAFKYFVLTAITFGMLLFGMSLVFLGTGSFDVPSLAAVAEGSRPFVVAGVALMVVGLLFKLAAAPVYFGALDAYATGPAAFVGFVMVASKLGAASALARLVAGTSTAVATTLLIVGLVTLLIGVLASFVQTDLRRLLAYSAVAHAGFLAIAAASASAGGGVAARFYVVGYGAAALLAFACLAGTGTEPLATVSLRPGGGLVLGRLRAAGLLLALFSLAGVPPLPGFWVKLAVLQSSWHAWGLLATSLAALGGVVGVIYYLKPTPDLLAQARGPAPARGLASDALVLALMGLVVVLGVWPAFGWALAK